MAGIICPLIVTYLGSAVMVDCFSQPLFRNLDSILESGSGIWCEEGFAGLAMYSDMRPAPITKL